MLKPFIPVSIVSYNEVFLFILTVEIEKHQRSVLCSFSTLDEYIHSFPLNLLLFFLGSSSLFCFSFRLKSLCRRSLPADDASFLPLKLISIWDFLNKSFFPIKDLLLLSFFSRLNQYLDSRRWETNHRQQQTKLFVTLNATRRSSDWRVDFSSSGQTNRSV